MNSGANVDDKSNASGYGFIGIDYNSLSDENKIIADTLAERGIINPVNKIVGSHGEGILTLKTPLTSETTVGEVERKLIELVNLFQPQDVLYGRKTIEDIKSQYRDNGDGTYYSDFLHGNVTREEMESFIEEDMEELQKNVL